ncbi:MAG: IclR family transcriptional regulator [Syntrophales bacterium]|nr:IclR family transcriptional regulator [Syntrophales bacterium]
MERKTAPSKPSNLVQTIERVSMILEMVGQNSRGMSIRDLSAGLNLPKGTIHRILASLSYFGYIRQEPVTKLYFLGLKLMDLNTQLGNQLDFRKVAEPILGDLAEKTKQTVHLVILDRDEVVYVDKVETMQPAGGLKMASRIGSRNPVHSSAVGKVLLSYYPDEDLTDFLQRKGLPRRTQNTITRRDDFRDHLKMVRSQGYATDDEENEQGIRCVGAPIFDDKGRPVAAISVSGSVFQMTKEAVQEVMKGEVMAAAAEISRKLGFRGGEPDGKGGR